MRLLEIDSLAKACSCRPFAVADAPLLQKAAYPEDETVQPSAEWFVRRTTSARDWPVERVRAAKKVTVSVVIPARNEAATIAGIVTRIAADLLRPGIVDELVVMDSDSTDGTADLAAAAGAAVHSVRAVRADLGAHPGKGEALWKSQFVTRGDVLVFIDADLTGWGTHFITGLLGPLFRFPDIVLVKGFYDRIMDDGTGRRSTAGGRVTELVARPLLNLHRPELAAVVQPLAGEWAVRRDVLQTLAIPVGYGIEMAVLLDVHRFLGLDAIAQVDLGERAHSHQTVHDLGVMAAEILQTAQRRVSRPAPTGGQGVLWQYDRGSDPPWRGRAVPLEERPPAETVPGYRRSHRATT
jgi:glucosyl-3-phosphoglycerate synthase